MSNNKKNKNWKMTTDNQIESFVQEKHHD